MTPIREVLIASLTLLVKANILTLEQVNEAIHNGNDAVWDLLNKKYVELEQLEQKSE